MPEPEPVCPRCGEDHIHGLADSPTPGVWRVLQCARCHYTWRTTEPRRRISREAYPAEFKLTRADIDGAPDVPPVPALRKSP